MRDYLEKIQNNLCVVKLTHIIHKESKKKLLKFRMFTSFGSNMNRQAEWGVSCKVLQYFTRDSYYKLRIV